MERRFKNQLFMALSLIFFFLLSGTIIFSAVEGWGFIDSFYFTGISLTSIGFGDFVPTTNATKIITVIYGFLGIGLVFYSMNLIARKAFAMEADQLEALTQKRVQRQLADEKRAKEKVEAEAQERAKAVEKAAVKIAKEIAEKTENPKTAKKTKK